jgi:hypothetical protein
MARTGLCGLANPPAALMIRSCVNQPADSAGKLTQLRVMACSRHIMASRPRAARKTITNPGARVHVRWARALSRGRARSQIAVNACRRVRASAACSMISDVVAPVSATRSAMSNRTSDSSAITSFTGGLDGPDGWRAARRALESRRDSSHSARQRRHRGCLVPVDASAHWSFLARCSGSCFGSCEGRAIETHGRGSGFRRQGRRCACPPWRRRCGAVSLGTINAERSAQWSWF